MLLFSECDDRWERCGNGEEHSGGTTQWWLRGLCCIWTNPDQSQDEVRTPALHNPAPPYCTIHYLILISFILPQFTLWPYQLGLLHLKLLCGNFFATSTVYIHGIHCNHREFSFASEGLGVRYKAVKWKSVMQGNIVLYCYTCVGSYWSSRRGQEAWAISGQACPSTQQALPKPSTQRHMPWPHLTFQTRTSPTSTTLSQTTRSVHSCVYSLDLIIFAESEN